MKVLFFVDTHGLPALDRVTEKTGDAELIVCAGDMTVFENDIKRVIEKFNSWGKPVVLIHGNHESEELGKLCEPYKNLHYVHNGYYIYKDYIFYGFGGGGFSQVDEAFRKNSEMFMQQYEEICEQNGKRYKLVLITHAPPYGTKLDMLHDHVGNKDIRDFIIKYKPAFAISGHIHETAGTDEVLEQTRMINPGSNGIVINI